MQFSDKIKKLSSSPNYHVSLDRVDEFSNNYLFKLENLNCYINILFDLKKINGEDVLVKFNYYTSLEQDYLGILDGFFELLQNKPIEVIDRIRAKELDYYLRDFNDKSAVSFYDSHFYEILSLGKKTLDKYLGKEKKDLLYMDYDTDFELMSFAEQVEMFEEFLAKCVYPYKKYEHLKFDLDDFEDNILKINLNENLSKELRQDIQFKLKSEMNLKDIKILIGGSYE